VVRRIFIGDIQGCRVELERLLERVRFDPAGDELHPVGDLVNRGPDSVGCLRLLRAAGAGGVLGNHDLHLLHAALGRRALREGDTLQDVLAAPDRAELLDWLAARPFVRAFDDVVLVHAGFAPQWTDPLTLLSGADPLAPDEAARFAVRVRRCSVEGELAPMDAPFAPRFLPWYDLFDRARVGRRTVVYGHWASQGLFVREGFRGLDSGCVWGNALTAWIPEEERLDWVRAERAYARIS